MKNNYAFVGYDSLKDFLQTNLGLSSTKFNSVFASFAVITGFVTNYIWDDPRAYYFLIFCLTIDFITGVWKAIKNKTFKSARMPRMILTMVFYSLILSLSWNAARSSTLFIWLPSAVYAGFLSTTLVSIFENVYSIGFLPSSIYNILKQRLKIEKYIDKDVENKKQ